MVIVFLISSLSVAEAMVTSENKDSVVTEIFSIYYECDSTTVNPEYLDNKAQITRILRYIKNSPRIDSITIYSWVSPEGKYEHNLSLSKERANTAKRFLLSNSPDSLKLNSSKIKISPIAENWEGLIAKVKECYHFSNRDAVLEILCDETISNDVRKWKLKCLDRGLSWRYMINNYMPSLRAASWVCVWGEILEPLKAHPAPAYQIPAPLKAYSAPAYQIPAPVSGLAIQKSEDKPQMRSTFGIKTNLLYDALLVPNLGIEFYLSKNVSLAANWMYAWWKNDPAHWYWRTYGGDVGLRFWFGKKVKERRFAGHHLGFYGQVVTYDIAFGSRGQIGGVPGGAIWDRTNFGGGLEYGYSVPVGKRLNLDFSIGVGYLGGEYTEYITQDDCYVWQATKYRNWIGPTKAEFSLVWVLGGGKADKKKGGER